VLATELEAGRSEFAARLAVWLRVQVEADAAVVLVFLDGPAVPFDGLMLGLGLGGPEFFQAFLEAPNVGPQVGQGVGREGFVVASVAGVSLELLGGLRAVEIGDGFPAPLTVDLVGLFHSLAPGLGLGQLGLQCLDGLGVVGGDGMACVLGGPVGGLGLAESVACLVGQALGTLQVSPVPFFAVMANQDWLAQRDVFDVAVCALELFSGFLSEAFGAGQGSLLALALFFGDVGHGALPKSKAQMSLMFRVLPEIFPRRVPQLGGPSSCRSTLFFQLLILGSRVLR
jgi:hypothetical protein